MKSITILIVSLILLINKTSAVQTDTNSRCRSVMNQLMASDLRELSDSAKIILNSLAHAPPDLANGSAISADFGDFDACIQLRNLEQDFTGKYCLYRLHYNQSHESFKSSFVANHPPGYEKFLQFETIAGSICMPSICSDEEILQFIEANIAPANVTRIEIRSGCETQERIADQSNSSDHQSEKYFQIFLTSWIIFVLSASLSYRTLDSPFLRCFSLQRNLANLLSQPSVHEYSFLYGWRIQFFVFGSIVHIYVLVIYWAPLVLINYANYDISSTVPAIVRFMLSHFSNTFGAFVVWSGFLSFPSRLNTFRRDGKFDYIKEYGSRIMRVLPITNACYLLIVSLPPNQFSGPTFRESFSKLRTNCLKNYWHDMTFTQYFMDMRDMCLPPTWILAPDMMYFTASFPVIMLYHKNPSAAKILILVLIMICMVMQAIYIHVNHLPAFTDSSTYDMNRFADIMGLHTNAVHYCSSYLIGMLASIYMTEGFKWINQQKAVTIMMVMAIFLYLPNYLWPFSWKFRTNVSRWEEIAYGSWYRTSIAIFVATFTVFQSTIGKDWGVTKFMSKKVFIIMGRFNYSLHLAHFFIIYLYVFTQRQPLDYGFNSMIIVSTALLIVGIILAFILHLLFEAPVQQLSILMFRRKGKIVSQTAVSDSKTD